MSKGPEVAGPKLCESKSGLRILKPRKEDDSK